MSLEVCGDDAANVAVTGIDAIEVDAVEWSCTVFDLFLKLSDRSIRGDCWHLAVLHANTSITTGTKNFIASVY